MVEGVLLRNFTLEAGLLLITNALASDLTCICGAKLRQLTHGGGGFENKPQTLNPQRNPDSAVLSSGGTPGTDPGILIYVLCTQKGP